jgi:hypothetical protein
MVALPLTNEQRAALAFLSGTDALPVFDPCDNRAYYLLPAEAYERLRGESEGNAGDIASLYALMDEVARREGWDDPEMDVYDQLDPRRSS